MITMRFARSLLWMFLIFSFWRLPPVHAAENLIANPSLELSSANPAQPDAWYQGGFGKNDRVFTYPVAGYDGGRAARVEIIRHTNGDAKWYFQRAPVTPGQGYVFSDQYTSTAAGKVMAQFQMSNGGFQYVEIGRTAASPGWSNFQTTFFIPSGAAAVTVFHLIASVGSLTMDEYSLTPVAPTDAIPPAVSLSAPTAGQTVSATTTVSVLASDNVGVAGVQLLLDGFSLGPELMAVPYAYAWDTRTAADGAHALSARVRDAAGNLNQATSVTVTVSNAVAPPPPPPPPPQDPTNLVANPSFEEPSASTPSLPDSWFKGGYGTNARALSYPVAGFAGARAAQVEITQFTNGDAKWYFKGVPVSGGEEYAYADYYRATLTSYLVADFILSNQSHSYVSLASAPAANDWNRISAGFKVPVGAVSITVFHLIRGVGTLTIDETSLKKISAPPAATGFQGGAVSFDFDDGYLGTYQNGLPILNRAGIRSTLHIISQSLGEPDYMTTEQMLDANRAGHDIGAHTRTHPFLPQLSPEQMRYEIEGSKQDLLGLGARPVDVFAYPYGEYNATAKQIVQEAGYIGARSVREGFNTEETDPFELFDQHVTSDVTVGQVAGWIDQAIRDSAWLILEFHNTLAEGGFYNHTTETLQGIVDYVVERQVKALTQAEGVRVIRGL